VSVNSGKCSVASNSPPVLRCLAVLSMTVNTFPLTKVARCFCTSLPSWRKIAVDVDSRAAPMRLLVLRPISYSLTYSGLNGVSVTGLVARVENPPARKPWRYDA